MAVTPHYTAYRRVGRRPGPPQISEYQAELIERGDPTALYIAVQEILQSEPPGTRADPEAAQDVTADSE